MADKLSFLPYIYRSSRETLFVRIDAKPKMIRLEAKDLPSAISEIKKRKIFKLDKSSAKKKKLEIHYHLFHVLEQANSPASRKSATNSLYSKPSMQAPYYLLY